MASRRVQAAALRLADQQSARLADIPASRLLRATVETVTPGAASDGNATVTVLWRGEELPVADYPDSYTPVAGHRVLCAVDDLQLSILHHSIGTP